MEAMTTEQATTFEHGKSLPHQVLLTIAAQERGCRCEAYQDWFTYRRWQAQGYQVQRGEHGVKLTTWIRYTTTDSKGNEVERVRPKGTTVFCQCQVKGIAAPQATVLPEPEVKTTSQRWIEQWTEILQSGISGPNYATVKDRLAGKVASVVIGRRFGETVDGYLERTGLTEFMEWARATLKS